jgi:hypothetical protein
MRRGSPAELETVAKLRGFSLAAVVEADKRGSLLFAEMAGRACWVLRSDCGRIAQARTMSGAMFERDGNPFKSWTCSGGVAAVPLGLDSLRDELHPVAIAEGGPDWISVLQLVLEQGRGDVGVIGFLGSSMKVAAPLLLRLAGRKVRIFAHADDAGYRAAAEWAGQLQAVGCEVDAFDFGQFDQVKDANDFVKLPLDQRDVEVFPS